MPLTPSPNPNHFDGAPVLTKRRTIATVAGQSGQTGQIVVLANNRPLDLTPYADMDLVVGFGETISHVGTEVTATLVGDATAGTVSFPIPDSMLARPGIWLGGVYVRDDDDHTTHLDDFYFHVGRSAAMTECGGLPSIAEIRMFLRDWASDNELLEAVDFDNSEIAFAADLCVQQWNEADPWDGPTYTTQNFPYRYNWLQAICGHLFLIAAEHYFRNALQSQTGGIAADDKNKGPIYERRGRDVLAAWKEFLGPRKTVDAVNGAVGLGDMGGLFS